MTNREQIEDNYEDALFAIWMDDFAQRQGEKLIEENERLKNDPAAAVPEHVQKKNLNLIYRELRRNTQPYTCKRIGKVMLHFLAAALILIMLFGCAYAVSPQFRAGALNLLMEFDEQAASFQLIDDTTIPETPTLMPTVTVGWLPEGYKGETPISDRLKTTIDCIDGAENLIRVNVFIDDGTRYTFDIENPDTYEDYVISGHPALFIQKENLLRISWVDESTGTYIYVESESVDKQILSQVAENISIRW